MNEKTNTFLVTEKIPKLMRMYALPCVISLLVAALYNIVDQIFIANADYLGSYGNAANTVVFPMTVVALSIAVMIGDGCCAFVSNALGRNDTRKAGVGIGNAIVLCIGSSILLMALYLLLMNPILILFGGNVNEQTFTLSKEYFFWISLGIPFYMFGQAMNPIIRSDASPKFAMMATVLGAVLNVILDPIFIYPMHMGMMGAAVATVLGQILTAALSIGYLLRLKMFRLKKEDFRISLKVSGRFLMMGLTSFLAQISLVLAMAAIQHSVTKYGAMDPIFSQTDYAQIPLAVLGIVMKFFQIVISIAVGLAAGCIPIVGYNMGAGEKLRAKELFRDLLVAEFIVGIAAWIIAEFFPNQIIQLFGAAQESDYYTSFALLSFRVYLSTVFLATVNKGCFIYLQGMGKVFESTLLSLCREIIFGCTFPLLLPVFFGLNGVLYSFPCSDILTFLITIYIVHRTNRQLSESDPALAHKTLTARF